MRLKAAAAAAAQQQQQPRTTRPGVEPGTTRSPIGFDTTRPPPRTIATERLKLIFIPNPRFDRRARPRCADRSPRWRRSRRSRRARPRCAAARRPLAPARLARPAAARAIATQHASRCPRCVQIRARPRARADAIDMALTARGRAARYRVPLARRSPRRPQPPLCRRTRTLTLRPSGATCTPRAEGVGDVVLRYKEFVYCMCLNTPHSTQHDAARDPARPHPAPEHARPSHLTAL